MRLLRSLAFAFVFYPATLLYVLATYVAIPFGPRAIRRCVEAWAAFYVASARVILGIHIRIEGERPRGCVLVAGKHQAMFETIAIVSLLDSPAVVMKRELADIPLWGGLTERYGIIPVDRTAGAAALRRMLKAADSAKAEGRPIVIFPEGTRVPPGGQPPLQPGFAGLYRMLDLPVVPLALDSGRLWPRTMVKSPGTIIFRFGEPIPPGLPRKEIEARVHAQINALER
jgi:1-acyl-sn-glycerol-3-phosphate acyltransferase